MRVLSSSQASQPESLASGGRAPRALGFEGQQGLSAGGPQGWGKQRLYSWRVHKRFHVHWDPAQSSDSIGAWARPNCGSHRVSKGRGGETEVSCSSLQGQGHWWWRPQRILIGMSSPRPGPTQEHAGSSTGTPVPNKQQDRNRAPPISRQAA